MSQEVDPNQRVEVSLIVRPRHSLQELEARLDKPMTREEFAASYGADPSDLAAVEKFAAAHRLDVVESSQPRRTVRLGGRAEDVGKAFGVKLQQQDGHHVPDREVQVPAELHNVVEGIFGLDSRPIAQHHPSES
jgi:kumamolisin